MRINTNIPSLYAYNALSSTNSSLQKSIQRLSTGLRINSAADDAAGLAISEKMRAQYRGLDQATSNAQDGISMIQTAEGALNETHSILQRMRELSVQAANDTLTQEDRSYIQLEVDQLKEEITRISNTTQFNKKQLLDGSAAALWSSDNLNTKAIINGGLRATDQFGQKAAVEGNFKISIKATPGQAEVQKSDLFKIKHKNVIMNVTTNEQAGFGSVRVDNMPAGEYNVVAGKVVANTSASARATSGYMKNDNNENIASELAKSFFASFSACFVSSGIVATENQSIMFEVLEVNSQNKTATFSVQIMALGKDGKTQVYSYDKLILSEEKGLTPSDLLKNNLGWTVAAANTNATASNVLKLADGATNSTDGLSKGDKLVVSYTPSTVANNTDARVTISGTVNADWGESWKEPDSTDPAVLDGGTYAVSYGAVEGNEVQFKQFYVNSENGKHYESATIITFNNEFAATSLPDYSAGGVVGASFEAAFVGQVAKGDVALRDLDKFWDANGKFMLDDPKTLTVVQGDGKKSNVTLYSTDTLEDVAKKLNNAIAYGLGQANYVQGSADKFVTFVEDGEANTSESVPGTMLIRSLIPGAAGRINLSGDEDIIKAFSLNVIQEAKENQFTVSVNDAHSGNSIASNVKITGNNLKGVINPNVDVMFDAMANIGVTWNEDMKAFVLAAEASAYETTLHLADNTTVFQIGANEGEDMSVDIGNMSAEALGVSNILVTDRESAARSITMVDNAISKVSSQRAKLGAYQNRLEHTINNLTTASTNMKSAESRIRDADMAKEMMNFTKLNILSQAGNSMLAQANSLPQSVLTLLR